jgi:hypothetical protein
MVPPCPKNNLIRTFVKIKTINLRNVNTAFYFGRLCINGGAEK